MAKTLLYTILSSIFLILTGCQNGLDREVEAMRLLKTDWSFAEMSLEKGAAEAFKAFLMDDAKWLPAGGDAIQGIDTIFDILKPGYENIVLRWEPKEADVSTSGDLGYTWGEYSMTFQTDTESPYSLSGKYVNIWRKNEKGEWRVIVYIHNQFNPEEEI